MAREKQNGRKKAGQAGGEATKAKYGPQFYQEIGSKGGSNGRSKKGDNRDSSTS